MEGYILNNKGISLIALVITVIILVILAAITAPMLSSVINDSIDQTSKVEIKNVQAVVENAKTLILTDKYVPNSDYVIKDNELVDKFGDVLTPEEIYHIETVNSDPNQKAPYKYYLLNQKRIDDEFGSEISASGIRENTYFLVNYMETLVLANHGGVKYSNKPVEIIGGDSEVLRGQVNVIFSPNGNEEWAKQQSTIAVITAGQDTQIISAKYRWSQEITEPPEDKFEHAFDVTSGTPSGPETTEISLTLDGETGNGWYLWILIRYKDVGVERKKAFRSEAFYIDNIPPSAIFNVEDISM
jgi:Tfp pilus assembly protein PilE